MSAALTDAQAFRSPGHRAGSTLSLLDPAGARPGAATPPAGFDDLRLECALAGAGDFQRGAWYLPPSDPGVVGYRQAVVTELWQPEFRAAATQLVEATAAARRAIDGFRTSHYPLPAEFSLAAAIARFTEGVGAAARRLDALRPASDGLRGLAAFLTAYVHGPAFRELAGSTVLRRIRQGTVELGIHQGTVWAEPDAGRPGWGEQIERIFSRFRESGEWPEAGWSRPKRYLNHVEAQAIGLAGGLFPDLFAELHRFVGARIDFLPSDLERLTEELRFYLGFLRLVDELSARGVAWCLPSLSVDAGGPVRIHGLVDLALAADSDHPPVANDLTLTADERVVFVTGPNQGGKTTFARSLGQAAYLAGLGLPVPARSASLPWSWPVLTHFPAPDGPDHDRGGLADELHRLRELMDAAGPRALLIFNELFSATSAADALQLSARVVEQIRGLGCRVVWVTFLEELVLGTEGAVSLVGQVEPGDATRPTFRFRAQPPGGRSHAVALAARHGLSSADLAERLR